MSTKITDEEFNFPYEISNTISISSYVVKANPSEIVRLLLRMFREYLLSHINDKMKMGLKNTK